MSVKYPVIAWQLWGILVLVYKVLWSSFVCLDTRYLFYMEATLVFTAVELMNEKDCTPNQYFWSFLLFCVSNPLINNIWGNEAWHLRIVIKEKILCGDS